MGRKPKEIIENIRRKTGAKNVEIAEASGLDPSMITRLFKDQIKSPSLDSVEKLEKAEQILLNQITLKPAKPTTPQVKENGKMNYDEEIMKINRRIDELNRYVLKIYSRMLPGEESPFQETVTDWTTKK